MYAAFGDPSSIFAVECAPPDALPLRQSVEYALGRLGKRAFLVVAADQFDHAAHANDTARLVSLADDLAAAVRFAAFGAGDDDLVVVTGDHLTVAGTRLHSREAVPLLLYGGRAAAAARAAGAEGTVTADAFPKLFPFYSPSCGVGDAAVRKVVFALTLNAIAFVLAATLVFR